MSKKEEIIEVEEMDEIYENEEIVEQPKEGFFTKVCSGFKKHGGKIAVGAIAVGAAIAGYLLGRKKSDGDDESYEDGEWVDVDYDDSDSTGETE